MPFKWNIQSFRMFWQPKAHIASPQSCAYTDTIQITGTLHFRISAFASIVSIIRFILCSPENEIWILKLFDCVFFLFCFLRTRLWPRVAVPNEQTSRVFFYYQMRTNWKQLDDIWNWWFCCDIVIHVDQRSGFAICTFPVIECERDNCFCFSLSLSMCINFYKWSFWLASKRESIDCASRK